MPAITALHCIACIPLTIMADLKLSQKEYLKKYLSSGNDLKKKKKKKKLNVGVKTVKIIDDDDVDINSMRPFEDGEFDILNSTEDAPQIVGVIDEKGPVDFADKRRWKIIADDGDGNVAISDNQNIRNDNAYEQMVNEEKELLKNSERNKKSTNHQPLNKILDTHVLSPPRSSRPKKHKKIHKRRKSHSSRSSSSSAFEEDSKKRSNHQKSNGRSDTDFSPPRKSTRHPCSSASDTFKKSVKKNTKRARESDADFSPPRQSRGDSKYKNKVHRHQRGSSSDVSPPRKNRSDRQKFRGSDFDLSPPRNQDTEHSRNSTNDGNNRHSKSTKRRKSSRWNDEQRSLSLSSDDERMKKTLDGKIAGLQNAKELRDETTAYKQRETELFNKMSVKVSGLGQAPVVRDRKTGRRRDLGAEALENRKKEERQMEIDEKYTKWGRGLKQIADRNEKLRQDAYDMTKAVARHADDVDLNNDQRNALHVEDPMLEYIKAKRIKEGKCQPDKPSYQGLHMPNRFGIVPGCRWDGVDRSNGYEKRWFEAQNSRTAIEEQAYKWSTSDM